MNKRTNRILALGLTFGISIGGALVPTAAFATPLTSDVVSSVALPMASGPVTPGAFCSGKGATGKTKAGTKMVCKTTAKDQRLRWRKA